MRDDVQLMVKNCIDFNFRKYQSHYRKAAKQMGTKAEKIFEEDIDKVQQAAEKKLQSLGAS